ncbi:glycoside hydrolase family 16 protein [Pseudonocardia humida]|uniref:Glycoside hydrolase family 16 protein n=1 Tax=Pseudonocardia humida TaxID=2800819 RepID=A0ABT0ZZ37_9PSEU|nr:family 16 glycosylhydrolase [Pseudonocardia humida]MCO1656008.1 glycoside hydrolase family 16 protein [Pseudonocardia humida]
MILIAGLVALALVATLVFVLVRPTGGDGGGSSDAGGGAAPASPAPAEPEVLEGDDTSAAKLLGWGEPVYTETFDGELGDEWQLYDGVGHGDNGRRSPEAISVDDGLLTITGDTEGTTGGMALDIGQMYGRWEGRVQAPPTDETYNALLLLWPDAEDWPEGGEVDFMEMTDPTRQKTKFFLHYSEDDLKIEGEVVADATQWRNWAVEWTPEHIVAYLDGKEWFRTEQTDALPPRPMHLTIQLDWFPEQGDEDPTNDVENSQMHVDWIRQYEYTP